MMYFNVGQRVPPSCSQLLLLLLLWLLLLPFSSMFVSDAQSATETNNKTVDDTKWRRAVEKLTVTTVLEEPYMMMRVNAASLMGNDRFEGYLADILRLLAESLGFEYEICLSTDGRYGQLYADGEWDGIIGEVARGERDIAAGPLTVTPGRRQVVEFTESFMSMRSAALLRKPTQTHQAMTTATTSHLSAATANRSRHQLPVTTLPTTRGSLRWPQEQSRHHNHEEANQSSSTVAEQLINATDLLRLSDFTYGVLRDGIARYQLSASTDDALRSAMWARLNTFWPSAFVDSLAEGVDRVRRSDGRFALIVDSPAAEYAASRRPCDLYATDPFLDVASYAFAVRKDATAFRRRVDQQLVRLRRESIMQSLYLKWWRSQCRLTMQTTSTARTPGVRGQRGGSRQDVELRSTPASSWLAFNFAGRHANCAVSPERTDVVWLIVGSITVLYLC